MRKSKSSKNPTRKRIGISIAINAMIIAVVVVMSMFFYRYMMKIEEENCWRILKNSAQSIESEIRMQVDNNINILNLVSSAMLQEPSNSDTQESLEAMVTHLNDFLDMTIFSRIDLLYKNGDVRLQTGEIIASDLDFQLIADKGIHFSDRLDDLVTGKQKICCVFPVVKDQETIAILMGVVLCEDLPKVFRSSMYDGKALVCLVDRPTGDFVMDNWHDTLGNLNNLENWKPMPGYETVDIHTEVSQGNTGVISYESILSGKTSYLYFQPVKDTNWELIILAHEDVVFNSLFVMRRPLFCMLGMVGFLLTAYLAWSIRALHNALKSKEASEKNSYIDSLTGIFNQNKFTQIIKEYEHMHTSNIGLLFLDLNGLKYKNDHYGHGAGDQLLKDTAAILSEFFASSVYRIGGDEFVVLASDISEAEFKAASARAKAALLENKIEAAVGASWHADCDSVKTMLKEADDLMYVDKRIYHERNKNEAR